MCDVQLLTVLPYCSCLKQSDKWDYCLPGKQCQAADSLVLVCGCGMLGVTLCAAWIVPLKCANRKLTLNPVSLWQSPKDASVLDSLLINLPSKALFAVKKKFNFQSLNTLQPNPAKSHSLTVSLLQSLKSRAESRATGRRSRL